jgi:hypothetical protein
MTARINRRTALAITVSLASYRPALAADPFAEAIRWAKAGDDAYRRNTASCFALSICATTINLASGCGQALHESVPKHLSNLVVALVILA